MEIVVPTGGLGNASAGTIAWKMGVPLKIITAVNSNDVVARALRDGDYTVKEEMVTTLSPAMDTLVSILTLE